MTGTENKFKGRHIAFLGDSITLGYGLISPCDRFSSVVCRELCAVEENYGITGTLMAKAGMNRFDSNAFTDRIELVKNADIIVIFGATNDYFWSDTPIYPKDEACTDNEYFINAVRYIFDYCDKISKASETLVITPYRHNGIGNYKGGENYTASCRHDTSEPNYNGHTLEDYALALVAEAKKLGMHTLDLYNADGFYHAVHTLDGCHPNTSGHRWLADRIEDVLIKEF